MIPWSDMVLSFGDDPVIFSWTHVVEKVSVLDVYTGRWSFVIHWMFLYFGMLIMADLLDGSLV